MRSCEVAIIWPEGWSNISGMRWSLHFGLPFLVNLRPKQMIKSWRQVQQCRLGNITKSTWIKTTDEWDISHLIFEGKAEHILKLDCKHQHLTNISKYHMTTTKIIPQYRHMICYSTWDNISLSPSKHPHPLTGFKKKVLNQDTVVGPGPFQYFHHAMPP